MVAGATDPCPGRDRWRGAHPLHDLPSARHGRRSDRRPRRRAAAHAVPAPAGAVGLRPRPRGDEPPARTRSLSRPGRSLAARACRPGALLRLHRRLPGRERRRLRRNDATGRPSGFRLRLLLQVQPPAGHARLGDARPGARSGEVRAARRPAGAARPAGARLQHLQGWCHRPGAVRRDRPQARPDRRQDAVVAVGLCRRQPAADRPYRRGATHRGPCQQPGRRDRQSRLRGRRVSDTAATGRSADVRRMTFDDNALLPVLYGNHDRHLVRIEQLANVQLSARGNHLAIAGSADDAAVAHKAIAGLYERLKRGLSIEIADVDAAVRFARTGAEGGSDNDGIRTRRRTVQARSPGQIAYFTALRERDMVFALGPAGSGKTYLAVAMGVSLLLAGKVERIVLSRPAVEAGERLGFLPGDMKEKIDPYLRPLYDALHDMLPAEQIANRMESGEIEIAPLAFMRGRTLAHCFVILDEAQNTTPMQMRMFLTRLGEGSRMVITGDPSQTDLPGGQKSGLADAVDTLKDVEGVRFIRLTSKDVVRHDLVTRIVEAYDARDKKAKPDNR